MNHDGGEPAGGTVRPHRNWLSRIFKSHDFARDLVVTTLGVLIALGIGEIVEEIRWKFRIAATEKAMRNELGLLHMVYIERQMMQPCVARRLSELGEILADARTTGRLPLVSNVAAPPNRADFGDSWEVMLGTEIPLHVAPEDLMATATAWVNEDAYSDMVDRERNAFDRLGMMENRAGPVSDNVLSELERQLTEARIASDATLWIARLDSESFRRNKITPLYRPDAPLDPEVLRRETRARYLCHPLQVNGRPYKLKGPVRKPREASVPAAS